MRLSDEHIHVLRQSMGLEPIAEDNPSMPHLQQHFGDHTFYIDENGLHIWQRKEQGEAGQDVLHAFRVAFWADEERTSLAPHEPVDIDVAVDVAAVRDGDV